VRAICQSALQKAVAQLLPRSCRRVAGARRSHGQRPFDAKIRVVVADTYILCRVVRPIDAVTDVRILGEHLEAVQQTWGYEEMPEVLVVQSKRGDLCERRGRRTGIYDHVMDCAARTANQLSFARSRPAVQASDDTFPRTRLRVLNKCGSVNTVLSRGLRVERAREEPTLIPMRCGDKNKNAGDVGTANLHRSMVPLTPIGEAWDG
jgi:hypothetical protein